VQLTSGTCNVKRNVKDPITGANISVDVLTKCRAVWFLATNELTANIPEAQLDRFDNKNIQLVERVDGGGLIGKADEFNSSDMLQAKADLKYRYQRTQALAAVAFYMIYTGVLPPIQMLAAKTVIHDVLKQAGSIGIPDTHKIRSMKRIEMMVKSCVVMEAIDLVFDSELSPIPDGKKFEFEQMLLLAPYLRATVEHAVFAIGMLRHQYENPIQHNVVEELARHYFKSAVKADKASKELNECAAAFADSDDDEGDKENEERDENTITGRKAKRAKTAAQPLTSVTGASIDNNYLICEWPEAPQELTRKTLTIDNNEDIRSGIRRQQQRSAHQHYLDDKTLVRDLAAQLHPMMKKKPQLDEVRDVLEKLTTQMVQDTDDPKKSVRALVFDNYKMKLSKTLRDKLTKNSLRTIVMDVASKCIDTPQTMVYGATLEARPYVFDVMYVEPNRNKKHRLVVPDSNYFDSAVRSLSLSMCSSFNSRQSMMSNNVFSKQPGFVVESSIDAHACKLHLKNAGIFPDSLLEKDMPLPLPTAIREKVLSQYDQSDQLPNYLEWITSWDKDSESAILKAGKSAYLSEIGKRELGGFSMNFTADEAYLPRKSTLHRTITEQNELEHYDAAPIAIVQPEPPSMSISELVDIV
jgi:hypothetical protein